MGYNKRQRERSGREGEGRSVGRVGRESRVGQGRAEEGMGG